MKSSSLLRLCIGAAAAVIAAHLLNAGLLTPLLVAAGTGRVAAADITEPAPTENFTTPTQITQLPPPETEDDAVISFSPEEAPAVSSFCQYDPDAASLLCGSLTWDLTGEEPTVLIVHTHTTECYADAEDPVEPSRSLNEAENLLAVGDEVARVLELGGVGVIHDRTVHDYPDYNSAYSAARKTIQSYLERYPGIVLVLDIHRDASSDEEPLVTAATLGGQPSAQIMMVVGTDGSGNDHPNWPENLALALKLTALLEREAPGITRPVNLRAQRFNMDLSPGSLIVEIGGTGNTMEEAILAANALARAVLALENGSA